MAAEGVQPAKKKMKTLNGLGFLRLHEVLMDAPEKKLICVHAKASPTADGDQDGAAPGGTDAVVVFEKEPFSVTSVEQMLSDDVRLNVLMQNDVYYSFSVLAPPQISGIKSTLIYPATERHIEKWKTGDVQMVHESADVYRTVTMPFLQRNQFSIQWVHNILEGKAEQDRLILNDPDSKQGFVLAPDLKWDGKTLENLYVTAIVRQPGIKSVRDLSADHLNLLNNIRQRGPEAIESRYGVKRSSLRIFLHYQPTYYHLHVHFVHLKSETLSQSAGKALLLDDVIDNIQLMADYYARKTMHFVLKTNNPLFLEFVAKGVVKPTESV